MLGRKSSRGWIRYVSSIVVLGLLFTFYQMWTVQGESREPRAVLMRLEDIGPGGEYGSLEQLGKLRAVLEELGRLGVPYHMALIPRWITIAPDGRRYDVSLDRTPDAYTDAFRLLLRQAEQAGAVIGMHGYTHQVGDLRRDDGHHESGIGNEFNVDGLPATTTAAFAEARLQEGLGVLQRAGIKPQFWEAPHYHTTAAQDEVFRSYFGLHYQAEVQSQPRAPHALYWNLRESRAAQTLGAVYVPTPFDYIPNNKDERYIVDRVGRSDNLASFFYHPFLEFSHLVPELGEDGLPLQRDGIPAYRYRSGDASVLQKLVAGLTTKGYQFYSIQDYVPFTPAHRLALPADAQTRTFFGDTDGDGQADSVQWNGKNGSIFISAGRFRGLRNEAQPAPQAAGRSQAAEGSAAALTPRDADNPCRFWIADAAGELRQYAAQNGMFALAGRWPVEAGRWDRVFALPQEGSDTVIAALSQDRLTLHGWVIRGGVIQTMKPFRFRSEMKKDFQLRRGAGTSLFFSWEGGTSGVQLQPDESALTWKVTRPEFGLPNETGEIRLGDFNGDGLEDALRWDTATKRGTVYLKQADGNWKLLSSFGPWGSAKSTGKLSVTDADGNGKSDLVLTDRTEGNVDIALSYIEAFRQ